MSLPVAEKAKEALKKKNGNGRGDKKPIPQTMIGLKSHDIAAILQLYHAQIAQVLPRHITPERLIQLCTTVINTNPAIMACTTASIIGAVMQSSILGLDPTPHLGQCYFVPYRNRKTGQKEVQFQIGYRGLIQLVRRTGDVATVYAHVVYEHDKFRFQYGLNPDVRHIPALEDRGELKYAYAVIKYKDGAYDFEVMNRADIMHIRAKSQAKDSEYSPWQTDEPEMWRKTVLKRLLKRQPLQTEDYRRVATDEAIIKPESFNGVTKEVDLARVEFGWANGASAVEEVEAKEVKEKTDEKKSADKKRTRAKSATEAKPKEQQETGQARKEKQAQETKQKQTEQEPEKEKSEAEQPAPDPFSAALDEATKNMPQDVLLDTVGTLGFNSLEEIKGTQLTALQQRDIIRTFKTVKAELEKQGRLL